ncbi:autotransporter domain-containing protein [Thiocystis violacea]|uniref:autotransporter domain-containing protein n=1 Tax=Thiocystis violacea TaxID=13725 RepID=UPI0019078B9C
MQTDRSCPSVPKPNDVHLAPWERRAQAPNRAVVLSCGALLACSGAALAQTALPSEPPPGYAAALATTTVNGSVLGQAVYQTCITGSNARSGSIENQRFQEDCNRLVGSSFNNPASSANALGLLAADQVNAQNSSAVRLAALGVSAVHGRLQRIRLAEHQGTDAALYAGNDSFAEGTGGGASADLANGPFGAFVTFDSASGDEDETPYQTGYEFNRWSFLGGLDYRFDDRLVSGLALRYGEGDFDFDRNRGDMDSESWGLIGYASYSLPDGFFIDGALGYSQNDYSLKRRINYTLDSAVTDQIAASDPEAALWNFNIGAGYSLFRDAWSITPSARLNYVNNDVDGYRERMSNPGMNAGGLALSVDSQTYESLSSELGFQIARAISHTSGVIQPQFRLAWIHEYRDDQERVGATFVNDINQQPLYILTTKPDPDYFELGLGVSAQFANGRSAFLSYNSLLGYDNVRYDAISAGFRLEF